MSGTDYTTTPNLGLYKPIRNKAVGTWGDLWNSNVDTIDALGGPSGSFAAKAFVQDTPPANPLPGQLWFDSSNPQLYVWFVDPTSAQWVIATAYAGGLTTDAPSDGQTYGRQNGAWLNIAAGGGYLPITGATPMTGPLTLSGNATLPLHAVPLQQLNAATTGVFLSLATGGTVAGATTFSATGFALQVPNGSASFGAGATGGLVRVQGQAGTTRTVQFTTNNIGRWSIVGGNAAEPGGGLNTGTPLEIDAYTDAGGFAGILLQAQRSTGGLGLGKPALSSFAPYTQAFPQATVPGGTVGNYQNFLANGDIQPIYPLPANPLSVTSGSPIVTINWPGAGGANGPLSKGNVWPVWVNIQSAAAVGGITPSGWLLITNVVDNNTFTVTWTANATSTATGGGSTVTVQPSFSTVVNNVTSTTKYGGYGFNGQTTELWQVDPYFLAASGQPSPRYLQRWHWTCGPPATTANNFSLAGVEWDLTNRGPDMGYAPDAGGAPNNSIGMWMGAAPIPTWATGGGTAANWNMVYAVYSNQASAGIGSYVGFSIQPAALVGAARDPTGHGGVGTDIFGSYVNLPGAPFTTAIGTSTVKVALSPGAVGVQSVGSQVWMPNIVTLSGVTFGGGVYTLTAVDATNGSFSIAGSGTAAASISGGGSGQWVAFSNLVPHSPHQIWGSFKHGLISTNARFESGGIIETQPGNGILWSDGTGTASITTSSASVGNTDIILTPAGTGRVVVNGQARMPLVVSSTGQNAVTGTLTETNLAVLRIPANSMGRNGAVEIKAVWTHTNNANAKTLIIRMTPTSGVIVGGITGGNPAPTTSASSQTYTIIRNNNATNLQTAHVGSGITPFGSAGSAPIVINNDTTVDNYINLNGLLANVADTITLIHVYAVIYYAP
jgi:hypothetical protein